jgi:hypothetical protein
MLSLLPVCYSKVPESAKPPIFRTPSDSGWTAEDKALLQKVRSRIEGDAKHVIDARYYIERKKGETLVTVRYVSGYDNGKPRFKPGGQSTVVVGSNGEIVKIIPGA